MPAPSAEHAPIMRQMSDELLQAQPAASVFSWHVLGPGPIFGLDRPRVYVATMVDAAGTPIGGESLDSPENKIVARYEDQLGWSARDDGTAFAYSVTEAREITDVDGTGTLDPDFADHRGLFQFQ
jgi:hypothetical protein